MGIKKTWLAAIFLVAIVISVSISYFYPGSAWHNIANIDEGSDFVTFVGAGDIAGCNYIEDEKTAALLDKIPGAVFTLGDNVYESGTMSEFVSCYAPNWGRHISRTMPSVGNHEYKTASAHGYFSYFSSKLAGQSKGYYSYNLGKWHIIVLNSNCSEIGGCDANSEQGKWLEKDLQMNGSLCTLAYMHHTLFALVINDARTELAPLWQLLDEKGADVVLAGHSHNYVRFERMDSHGSPSASGPQLFIAGTGGAPLRKFETQLASAKSADDSTHGVLKFTLLPAGYNWEFVPVEGQSFTDSGSAQCS